MKHFILTRYNHGWKPNEQITVKRVTKKISLPSNKWLEDRLTLFQKYYLPSIEVQTNKNFKVYLSFSDQTPKEYLNKVRELITGLNIEITFEAFDEQFKKKLFTENPNEDILTTRIDNDDAISPFFVNRVQTKANSLKNTSIIDVWGYKFKSSNKSFSPESYNKPHASSFCTVFSKKSDYKWVYETSHTNLPQKLDNHTLINERLYIQVIHNNNLANNSRNSYTKKVKGFSHLFSF